MNFARSMTGGPCSSRVSGSRAGTGLPRILALPTLCLLLAPSLRAAQSQPELPVLHTVREAHTLPIAEARRGYPVHIDRAQITYYDKTIFCLFLIDSTDGIFVDFRHQPPPQIQPGDIVRIDAVTGPGKVNPVLLHATFHVLRHAPLPEGPLVSFDRILTGAWDCRWISLEGIVRAVQKPTELTAYAGEPGFGSTNLILTLSSGPDVIDVITQAPASANYSSLVDAKVRIRAAVGTRFNQRLQLIGVHVYMPDLSYVNVIEPPPGDPFSLPISTVAGVMRGSLLSPGHRVRVRGVVTSSFQDQFSLMDAVHGIFVYPDKAARAQVGDLLDVVGFPSMGADTAVLEDAVYRRLGTASPPHPVAISAAEALSGEHDAEPITVEALLVYKSRTASESSLLLNDNGVTFTAALPSGSLAVFDRLQPGSRLRITGICQIDVTPTKIPKALRLLLQSPAGVTVLTQPSWWTARKALILVCLLLAAVAVAIAINLSLRRRVRAQTRVISDQLEEAHALRRQAEAAHQEKSDSLNRLLSVQRELLDAQKKLHYQATHDGLTGLWNRRALLELFEKELERCLRTSTTIGILMLDVDHFKLVNDSFGHLAGDEVLKEIAHRITAATRGYDLSGRYGGEEFLILMPGCDRKQTIAGAERIRSAICSTPIEVTGTAIALTVSIGATVAPDHGHTQSEILALADIALYQAKTSGRNRTSLRMSFRENRSEA
jgi:diguanylate cyclase (GGDEF)-like protein